MLLTLFSQCSLFCLFVTLIPRPSSLSLPPPQNLISTPPLALHRQGKSAVVVLSSFYEHGLSYQASL